MSFPVFRQAAALSLAFAAATSAHADPRPDTVVIDDADIARAGAGSVADVLRRQRGIEIARNGGAGTNTSVFLRGANGNQIVVLVDGVRVGSATTGAAAWSAIPLSSIDHIEIVYGPLCTLYGADAIGGGTTPASQDRRAESTA
jgi:vitamin B12 transporter